jgi:uncharacterized protein (DUF1697 family)
VATQIVMLRGVNLGSANGIGMPVLREALSAAGAANVRTYLQSGNVVADGDPETIVAAIRAVIDVPCVLRSAREVATVIDANPFPEQAREDPKLLQVTFRSEALPDGTLAALQERASDAERVAVTGREIYSWHPDGIARSKLAVAVVPPRAAATARNWNTVLALAELAGA